MGLQKFESYSETCDNPRCNKGENGEVKSVKWTEEQMKSAPDSLDAGFFRLIRKQLWQNENNQPVLRNLTFCSEQCDRYWMRDIYKHPLGPQELAALANQDKQVELPLEPMQEAIKEVREVTALAQADGAVYDETTDNDPRRISES